MGGTSGAPHKNATRPVRVAGGHGIHDEQNRITDLKQRCEKPSA